MTSAGVSINPITSPEESAPRVVREYQAGDMARVIAIAEAMPIQARNVSEIVLLAYGLALHAVKRDLEAVSALRQLVQLKPDVAEYWNNLAIAAQAAGEFDKAKEAFLQAIALAPQNAQFRHHLGLVYAQLQQWSDARRMYLEAVQLAPDYVEARLQAALACHICGDISGEEYMLENVAQWPPQPAEQALTLANILSTRGEQTAAFKVLEKSILPTDASEASVMRWRLMAMRGALYERCNQVEQATAELAAPPLVDLATLPNQEAARHDIWHVRAILLGRQNDLSGAATLWQEMLDRAVTSDQRAAAAFGLATTLDKLGRHAEAWSTIEIAHAEQLETVRHIVPQLLDENAQSWPIVEQRVTRSAYDAWNKLPPPSSEKTPVFVVGFPRSGTTLLEQMIDAHPDFRSMDERAFIYELIERMQNAGQPYPDALADLKADEAEKLRRIYAMLVAKVLPDLGAAHLVDKNPLNMFSLPMIMRLYPEARIILCLRHPCDVLLSCYMLPFRSPAFVTLCSSLKRLARGYVQVFEQWFAHAEVFAPRVLEWRYEFVVEHFDDHVQRLGHFLDVADCAPMKRFDEHARNKGYISTPSYAQVTRGINRTSINRWHAYREAFKPVLPILRPMMERLGYDD